MISILDPIFYSSVDLPIRFLKRGVMARFNWLSHGKYLKNTSGWEKH
jgi:hypothetical protein